MAKPDEQISASAKWMAAILDVLRTTFALFERSRKPHLIKDPQFDYGKHDVFLSAPPTQAICMRLHVAASAGDYGSMRGELRLLSQALEFVQQREEVAHVIRSVLEGLRVTPSLGPAVFAVMDEYFNPPPKKKNRAKSSDDSPPDDDNGSGDLPPE